MKIDLEEPGKKLKEPKYAVKGSSFSQTLALIFEILKDKAEQIVHS